MPVAAPARGLRERLVEDERGEPVDQAGGLGERDELVRRRRRPRLGMLPPDQRLDPATAPVARSTPGLVVQHQLVAVERPAQVAEQAQPRWCTGRVGVVARRRRLWRPWPAYIATSARRSSVVDVAPWSGYQRDADAASTSSDDLARARTARPARARIRSASSTACGRRRRASRTRELVAAEPGDGVARAAATLGRRRADLLSSSSPTWWPRVSLTSLNRSRSSRLSTDGSPASRRPRRAQRLGSGRTGCGSAGRSTGRAAPCGFLQI